MNYETNLLIIGAGPFGLALAAQATLDGIEHLIVGKPMEFWRRNMPLGMYLRSACDWHLDPEKVHTIEAFLNTMGKTPAEVEPLSLDFYLAYVEWFQVQKEIHPLPLYVQSLEQKDSFVATTSNGAIINAKSVVLAPGFKHFANVPDDLKARLPSGCFEHTCDFVDFTKAKGQRYLIIGGRQSAFEWAALLQEAGADAIHISHRHTSPAFAVADWSWVTPLVDMIADKPNWFRNLSQAEKDQINKRMWAEGRLKIEPWLEARLKGDRVKLWPETEIVGCIEKDGELMVDIGPIGQIGPIGRIGIEPIAVDKIVLATGYKVDISRVPVLSNLIDQIETRNGFPVLDDHFETSVPELFITSMPAIQDFGPFFGFTIAVRTSARLICARLRTNELKD